MDEIQLVREALSSAETFTELYRRHVIRVYCYHLAHTGVAKDAEELTSQTFMAALEELRSFRGGSSFAAWIMGSAAPKRHQHFRGNMRELPVDAVLYYQASGLPTDKSAMQRKEIEATSRALKQISVDQAEAIILMFFSDLTSTEVGHVLKKSAGAVTMLIGQGIQDLRTRSSLTPNEDTGTMDADAEDERLAEKLANIANQITPDPLFISELEQALLANHHPKTKWTLSLQQVASLAGWAALIGLGVFLLNWRVTSNSPSTQQAASGSPTHFLTEVVVSEPVSTPTHPSARATATHIPTREYTVQAGDTCTYIAEQYGVTVEMVITLNDLNSSCDIFIDQILVIPITTPTPSN